MTSRARLIIGLLILGCSGFFIRPLGGLHRASHAAPGIQEMQARLNAVSLGLLAYLQTHRPTYLDVIKNQGQEATELLRRFKNEAGTAHTDLIGRIATAHEKQRRAALAILDTESAQQETRMSLQHDQALLLQLLNEKLLSNTQAAAWRGSNRLRWLMSAIAEVKALSVEDSATALKSRSTIFLDALQKYRHESAARQMGTLDEAQRRWDACVADAQKVNDEETAKRQGLVEFTQARADLDSALEDYRKASALSTGEGFDARGMASPYVSLGLVAGCWLMALLLLRPFFRTHNDYTGQIQRLSECVEAVASGDLSRLARVPVETGLERLALGLIRLSAVLTRSENLVYHLAALVEASGDAIVSQNLDGKILSWNKGAQRLYGYAIEEVRGHSIGILSPLDEGTQLRQLLDRVKSGEKINPFETMHQAKNGRLVRALVKVSAIHDSLKQVIGVSFCAQELAVNPAAAPLTDTFQRS